ncbi:MAG: class I SAM-dependent methyltransferase [Pyrinomonadaceae bacterium]
MTFKDHFSKRSSDYAKYRPTYPLALFEFLASVVPSHQRAWDCATGNGQAARGLASFFEHIIATDASSAQISNAPAHEKITYSVAPAEQTGIESGSIDLVTVAQALHWLDLDKFYAEVQRVLRPSGIFAAWSYDLLNISAEIDPKITHLYEEVVGPYWPPERSIVEDGYRSVAFPFREVKTPHLRMQADWSLAELLGYVRSWSATQRFIEARGFDPVPEFAEEMLDVWGVPEEKRPVAWPLSLRVGIVAS